MDDTKIEWADDTANPWWGCTKASPACANCYAETLAARWHGDALWGPQAARRLRLDAFERDLERIARRGDREGRPRRVFIASMGDIFEDRADLVEPRQRVWDVLHRLDGRIVPMLLTKRPAIMAAWAKSHGWPEGAWAGCTVEDQQRADERVPELLRVPAEVRFLSCEPLLGPVDLDKVWCHYCDTDEHLRMTGDGQPWCVECDTEAGHAGWLDGCANVRQAGINWIIAGGESGARARPMHPAWVWSLRDQAVGAGVPFHFKQWGEWAPADGYQREPGVYNVPDGTHCWPNVSVDTFYRPTMLRVGKKAAGRMLDGLTWDEVPHVD